MLDTGATAERALTQVGLDQALLGAVENGNLEVVTALCEAGADVTAFKDCAIRRASGRTAKDGAAIACGAQNREVSAAGRLATGDASRD